VIGYRTSLGNALEVPVPAADPAYLKAITTLNRKTATRIFIENPEPPLVGLNAFLTKYALLLATGPPLNVLDPAYTEWLPQMQAAGSPHAAAVRANLASAAANANRMADFIVRLRQTSDPAYATARWATSGPTVTVPVHASNRTLLNQLNDRRDTWASIFRSTGSIFDGALLHSAVLTPRQYTEFQMMLWWQAIEQAADNITEAMKGYQRALKERQIERQIERQDDPKIPVAPTNPTPEEPEGSTAPLTPVLGIALVGAIAWWYVNRTRVKSL